MNVIDFHIWSVIGISSPLVSRRRYRGDDKRQTTRQDGHSHMHMTNRQQSN